MYSVHKVNINGLKRRKDNPYFTDDLSLYTTIYLDTYNLILKVDFYLHQANSLTYITNYSTNLF